MAPNRPGRADLPTRKVTTCFTATGAKWYGDPQERIMWWPGWPNVAGGGGWKTKEYLRSNALWDYCYPGRYARSSTPLERAERIRHLMDVDAGIDVE